MADFTISCSQGRIAEHHNKREYTPKNADPSLAYRNKTFVSVDDWQQEFNGIFQSSIDRYNAKQKRADRKKSYDYYDEIAHGDGKEKPFYEYVLQIGNRDTNGVKDNSQTTLELNKILQECLEELPARYPAFHFLFVGFHGDEPNGTGHGHIDFIPVGTGYKGGMDTRCSLNKALESMGFVSKGHQYAIDLWKQDVEHFIEGKMAERGYGRAYANEHRRRLDIPEYKYMKMVEDLETQAEEFEFECSQIKQGLDDRESKVASEEDALDKVKQLYYEKSCKLVEGLKSLQEQEEDIEEREDELQAREQACSKREKACTQREEELHRREEEFEEEKKTYKQQVREEFRKSAEGRMISQKNKEDAEEEQTASQKAVAKLLGYGKNT